MIETLSIGVRDQGLIEFTGSVNTLVAQVGLVDGLGTVAKDGSTITSNLGSGVIKAGWHCGSAPRGSTRCKQPPGEDCPHCFDLTDGENCNPGECEINKEKLDQPNDCSTSVCAKHAPGIFTINDKDDLTEEDQICNKCENETLTLVEDRPLPADQQEPDDCRILTCGGEPKPADEASAIFNTPNDCKKPVCIGIQPSSTADEGDHPRNACIQCVGDQLTPVTEYSSDGCEYCSGGVSSNGCDRRAEELAQNIKDDPAADYESCMVDLQAQAMMGNLASALGGCAGRATYAGGRALGGSFDRTDCLSRCLTN